MLRAPPIASVNAPDACPNTLFAAAELTADGIGVGADCITCAGLGAIGAGIGVGAAAAAGLEPRPMSYPRQFLFGRAIGRIGVVLRLGSALVMRAIA